MVSREPPGAAAISQVHVPPNGARGWGGKRLRRGPAAARRGSLVSSVGGLDIPRWGRYKRGDPAAATPPPLKDPRCPPCFPPLASCARWPSPPLRRIRRIRRAA